MIILFLHTFIQSFNVFFRPSFLHLFILPYVFNICVYLLFIIF